MFQNCDTAVEHDERQHVHSLTCIPTGGKPTYPWTTAPPQPPRPCSALAPHAACFKRQRPDQPHFGVIAETILAKDLAMPLSLTCRRPAYKSVPSTWLAATAGVVSPCYSPSSGEFPTPFGSSRSIGSP